MYELVKKLTFFVVGFVILAFMVNELFVNSELMTS